MNKTRLKTNNLREKNSCYEDIQKISFNTTYEENCSSINISVNNIYNADIKYYSDKSNCKLSYLNYMNRLIDIFNGDKNMEPLLINVINDVFERIGRFIIYVTVTRSEHMEFIKNNFKCLFINRIPFGDDDGQQFHIAIANEENIRYNFTISNALNSEEVKSVHTFTDKDYFKAESKPYGTKRLDTAIAELRERARPMRFGGADPLEELMREEDDEL